MQEMQETQVWSLGREDPLEKEITTHSSILVWEIPWTEEPGGLHKGESQRVGHGLATKRPPPPKHTSGDYWTLFPIKGSVELHMNKARAILTGNICSDLMTLLESLWHPQSIQEAAMPLCDFQDTEHCTVRGPKPLCPWRQWTTFEGGEPPSNKPHKLKQQTLQQRSTRTENRGLSVQYSWCFFSLLGSSRCSEWDTGKGVGGGHERGPTWVWMTC